MTLRKKDPTGFLSQPFFFACMLSWFSWVQLFVILWTVTHQAPLSMGFSRQEYWSELPCPPSGGSSWLRYQTRVSSVSCLSRQFLYQFCHLGSLTFFLHYILSICTARLFDSSIYLFIYQFLKVSCVGRMGRVKSHFIRENFYTQRLF